MRLIAAAALCALAGCLEAPPASHEGAALDCGTSSVLEDEFDGVELDRELWDGTGGASASDGVARIESAAGAHDTLYSLGWYRVSGSTLVAELDVSQVADALLWMELESAEDARVAITLLNGDLGLRVVDGEGERTIDNAPLEQDHVWWRLREDAGQFFWATSPDGADWTERGPFAASLGEITRVDFELASNAEDATWTIEAVNPGSEGVYCPASSFQDDFTGLSPRWSVDEQGDCQITVANQAQLGYSAQAFCALTSRERFDLTDSVFSVELAEVGDCIPEPTMRILLADGDEVILKCADKAGETKIVAQHDTAEVAVIPYDEDKDRFVRVRHDSQAGSLLFEASPGDGVWSRFGSLPVMSEPLADTSLRFFLGGDTSGGFESIAFDSLNIAP
jgi:hypothetical protein